MEENPKEPRFEKQMPLYGNRQLSTVLEAQENRPEAHGERRQDGLITTP